MIKIDLITGFLGAGKTTFMINYAKYLVKQNLALLKMILEQLMLI